MVREAPVESVTADELLARMRVARERLGDASVVASDGDGTLWTGDIGDALFDHVADGPGFHPAARDPLVTEARAAGVDADGDATAIAQALRHAYREGRYDEGRYFAMQTWAFAGWSEAALADTCGRVLDGFAIGDAVRPSMRRILDGARAMRIPFFLVSASPDAIVREAAVRIGIDPSCAIAMRPSVVNGVVEARLATTPTFGPGKVARLDERIAGAPVLAAFGDNVWDAAMLERARLPVLVQPKPRLRERLAGHPGLLELEGA